MSAKAVVIGFAMIGAGIASGSGTTALEATSNPGEANLLAFLASWLGLGGLALVVVALRRKAPRTMTGPLSGGPSWGYRH